MKSARSLAAIAFALAIGAGCASTKVSDRQVLVTEKIARPDRILVYPFDVAPGDIPGESALAGQVDAAPMTAQELAEGRELGAQVASALADEIQQMGLPAAIPAAGTRPQIGDIVIRGYFVSIDEGSAAQRMVVGFGAGAAELKTVVEGFQMTPAGLRKLGSGSVASGGGKGPGAAVPAAVAIATANPVGLIVSSAVKVGGEVSGKSTIEGRAKATAKEIAEQVRPRFEQQGWIQ